MKNSAFTSDFDIIMQTADCEPRLNDVEVKNLHGTKDLYGTPIQFGDPLIYVHRTKHMNQKIRDIEFINFVGNVIKLRMLSSNELNLRRHPSIQKLLETYRDVSLLSELNITKASNDYRVITSRYNHIIVESRR